MKSGPDIAPVAALLGDPARANMLTALLGWARRETDSRVVTFTPAGLKAFERAF